MVDMDFEAKRAQTASPFVAAKSRAPRLKLFVYGPTGAGKTTLAVQMPGAAVIDLEGGAVPYAGRYSFDLLPSTGLADVEAALLWLSTSPHPYKTLVLDPITILWEMVQRHWSDIFLKRNKMGKGYKHEFYDLQIRDWSTVKSHWKEIMRRLLALDMNIVATAREKALYTDGPVMKELGRTFDSERSTPYLFDTVVRLAVTEAGTRMATVEKDRWGALPAEPFLLDFGRFATAFGSALSRDAVPAPRATEAQIIEIINLIGALGVPAAIVDRRLAAYGAERVEDLTSDAAALIITRMSAALAQATIEVSAPTVLTNGTNNGADPRQ